MIFLAEKFGEGVHVTIFEKSLNDILYENGSSLAQLFSEFRAWFDSQLGVTSTSYVPNVACTGRYSMNSSRTSFEVMILNNYQRSREYEIFKQQYRANGNQAWVSKSGNSIVPWEFSQSSYSVPLFSGPNSLPFEWRVRACSNTDLACSDWSNVVHWTVASCAQSPEIHRAVAACPR